MKKLRYFLFGEYLLITFFAFLPPAFSQAVTETITISTYYPSPVGVYRELRAKRAAIGDNYYNASQYCWPPAVCANPIDANADLVVEGNVGIGTTNPIQPLEVYGSVLEPDGKYRNRLIVEQTEPNDAAHLGGTELSLRHGQVSANLAIANWARSDNQVYADSSFSITLWNGAAARSVMRMHQDGNIYMGGNVGIDLPLTTTPMAKLDVAGGVKISDDATCDPTKPGTLRYNSGQIQFCNGSIWKKVGGGNIATARLTSDISTRSTTPVNTGVSATITASGNPIQIIVDVGATLSCSAPGSGLSNYLWMRVVRDNGVVVGGGPELGKNAVAYAGHNYGGFTIIDTPPAGEHTYKVQWWVRGDNIPGCGIPDGRIYAATGHADEGGNRLNLYLID